MAVLVLDGTVSAFKRFPESHAVQATREAPRIHSVKTTCAKRDERNKAAQSMPQETVWLMKRNWSTKCIE